jgi:hypothetical protein
VGTLRLSLAAAGVVVTPLGELRFTGSPKAPDPVPEDACCEVMAPTALVALLSFAAGAITAGVLEALPNVVVAGVPTIPGRVGSRRGPGFE